MAETDIWRRTGPRAIVTKMARSRSPHCSRRVSSVGDVVEQEVERCAGSSPCGSVRVDRCRPLARGGRGRAARPAEATGRSGRSSRLFEQPGGERAFWPERVASVEEVAAVAAAAEGLTTVRMQLARVTGAGPDAASVVSAATCDWVEYSPRPRRLPLPPLGRRPDLLVLPVRRRHHLPRRARQSARVDGVCSGSNAREWKVSGGAGYSWVVVHHEADFSCTTPWWFPLNDTLWMEATFNSYGNAWLSRRASVSERPTSVP